MRIMTMMRMWSYTVVCVHGTSILINKNVIIFFPKRKVIKIEEKGFQIMYLLL